jgi:N-acetylglucosamine repressor
MPRINMLPKHLLRLLYLIHDEGRTSRSQLAKRTGYSNFLVSKLTERLLKNKLICEVGSGASSGGRRPSLLSINPKIGYLVGVHLGTINLRAVVTDLCGNVVAWRTDRSRVEQGPEKALQHLGIVVSGLLKEAHIHHRQLLGFGMGIGAVSDWQSGVALSWPKVPSWINVPVRRMMEEKFHTVVEMDDVSRTAALAEKRFGKARDASEFIHVLLGAGTGAALFLGGKLYGGKGGFAGEFGHTTIEEHGPLCSCGNRGCLEALVSGSAIIRQAREALAAGLSPQLYQIIQTNGGELGLESIAQAAETNDRFCLGLLSEIAAHIATGITNLINLLNPELVVFGGGLIKAAGKWLLPPIQRVVLERAMPNAARQVTLELSELKDVDWARGATLLVAKQAIHGALLAREKQ